MSWFFGKKKSSPSTPPETTAANIPNSEGDDFIFVERKSSLKPNLEDSDPRPPTNSVYPSILPYSLGQPVPGIPATTGNHLNRQDSVTAGPHMLQGLPFKLAPNLDTEDSVHIRHYTEFANDVLFQISQINIETCNHDFSVENSVLREVNLEDDQ